MGVVVTVPGWRSHAWNCSLPAHLSCCVGLVTCRGCSCAAQAVTKLAYFAAALASTCDFALLLLCVQGFAPGIVRMLLVWVPVIVVWYDIQACHGGCQCCCRLCRVLLPLVQDAAPDVAAAVGAAGTCVGPAASSVHGGGTGACWALNNEIQVRERPPLAKSQLNRRHHAETVWLFRKPQPEACVVQP